MPACRWPAVDQPQPRDRQRAARASAGTSVCAMPACCRIATSCCSWQPQPQTQPNVASFSQDIDGTHYAMLMLLPPQQQAQRLPRELILIIDTSGSMGGESIRQARAALDLALSQLQPGDRFNVAEFNSILNPWATRRWPPRPRPCSRRAPGSTSCRPRRHRDGAGAELCAGRHAPAGYVRQVLFATDGAVDDPNGLMQLIDEQLGDSRLFPIGIGSAPNARVPAGRGAPRSRQRNPDHRHRHAGRGDACSCWQSSIIRPCATCRWTGRRAAKPIRDSCPICIWASRCWSPRNWPQPIAGCRCTASWPIAPGRCRPICPRPKAAEGLDRLWAQSRIADLSDQLARGGDGGAGRSDHPHRARRPPGQPYTSLVAVDQTPARSADATLKHQQIPNVMPAGTHFAQTATSGRAGIVAGTARAGAGGTGVVDGNDHVDDPATQLALGDVRRTDAGRGLGLHGSWIHAKAALAQGCWSAHGHIPTTADCRSGRGHGPTSRRWRGSACRACSRT